ncbi:MAG: hypothetical protein ACREFW_05945 [Rhizomicrobium sp.]
MPQPCFDRQYRRLSERLLRAGIAPRHVRRYGRELGDHFDDLVREERTGGAARELAETKALARLGNDDALAQAMLSRPQLRSLTARYPWAVFGLGPVVVLALSVVGALYLEIWLLHHSGGLFTYWTGRPPGPVTAKLATQVYTVYNTLAVTIAPLLFAWLFYWLGSRQRLRPVWIVTGVVLICVLGGVQELVVYDKGYVGGGVLSFQSGLLYFVPLPKGSWLYSAHPHFVAEIAHAAMNLAIAGGAWFLSAKWKASHPGMALSPTART